MVYIYENYSAELKVNSNTFFIHYVLLLLIVYFKYACSKILAYFHFQ